MSSIALAILHDIAFLVFTAVPPPPPPKDVKAPLCASIANHINITRITFKG